MATLDEIFAAMPDEAAAVAYEPLVIDPDTRQIAVPESEAIFGVEADTSAERKYFECPRIVGSGVDLAACFLRVNFRNANGDMDACLVDDLAVSGDLVTFSWELSRKVTQYKGLVQFVVCACYPGSDGNISVEWHTTLASGRVLEGMEPDAAAVEAASSDVIAQLLALVEKQSAAVQAEGTAQITNVQAAAAAAAAAAKEQVEAKGAATLATIPEDYTVLAASVDTLVRSKAPAIVCAAEGQSIQVQDASDDALQGLQLFGRSTQDGTPTPEAPVEIVSLAAPVVEVYGKNICPESAFATMGASGKEANTYDPTSHTITMDADPTTTAGRYCAPCRHLVIGRSYIVSFDLRGTTGKKVRCGWDINYSRITLTADYVRYSAVVVATRANEPIIFYSAPTAEGGLAAGEFMQFDNVQIEVGSSATDYEPYKEAQSLVLTTPTGLPGIPVASGGNYTDAEGQEWVCDEVDLACGVYVQRVAAYNVTGAETWMLSDYQNNDTNCLRYDANVAVVLGGSPIIETVCTHYPFNGVNGGIKRRGAWIASNPKTDRINIRIMWEYTDENELKEYLQAQHAAGTPVVFLYALTSPVETPLSDAEIAAWRALHSNKPTTTILNDAGAWMAAEYSADPKLYIDRKLAELVAANNA